MADSPAKPSFTKPSPPRGYLIALAATAAWSSTAVFIRYLTTSFQMPPLALAFWRDLIVAGALGTALAVVAPPLLRVQRRNVPFFALYGLVLAAFNALWTVSITLNGAAVATVLAYSSPAFTALIGWRLSGRRLGPLHVALVGLNMAGCVMVSGAYDRAIWQLNPLGIVLGLLTGVAFAVYSLLGNAASERRINPWTSTLYTFLFAALFLAFLQRTDTLAWVARLWAYGPEEGRRIALAWGVLALLAIGPTIGGYGLYTVSLTHLPATTASLIATLEPALSAALAFWFLGERLAAVQLLGGGLILGSVVIMRLSEYKAEKRERQRQAEHQAVCE